MLRGTKIFTLYPPCAAPFLAERSFRTGTHTFSGGSWDVQLDEGEALNWVDIGEFPTSEREPPPETTLSRPRPLVVEVRAGEVLYLPAM